ncbi:VQ motif-containing protein [Tasmannia lanceolata]|uniref:VQ motif-containing protein n=1 Tax=Tasmannia lanceolata TaxID=3420 RepID=UPI004064B783
MDNSNFNQNRHNEHLGVNKMGKNIRKSPLHQPNFGNPNPKQPPQPQIYNISKNDFRNIVQQLTGSPSQDPPPIPPHNPPKPPSMRLQKIRPPPLTTRPPIPQPPVAPAQFNNNMNPNANPNSPFFGRPGHPSFPPMPPVTPVDSIWSNTADSPISAYMRYLQNSIDTGSTQTQVQGHGQGPSSGILPTPPIPAFPSPRGNNPPLLPSPTSQFLLQSPNSFLNLLSQQSPYPLLSPGFQYPPPLTPNFSFSPLPRSPGILGPGPQPPPSPGFWFPSSPSGFLPIPSPRWRD